NPMLEGLNKASIDAALLTLRRPAPTWSTPAFAVWSALEKTTPSAEFTSADFICSGVQSEWSCLISAADPVTCGAAALVPSIAKKPLGSATPSGLHPLMAPE